MSPSLKLSCLRGVFFGYFLTKTLIGAIFAWSILQPVFRGSYGWRGQTAGAIIVMSVIALALILALAWLVFDQLLQRKNWARIVLLIVGWVTVTSALFGLMFSNQMTSLGPWIDRFIPNIDWQKVIHFDRVQKIFEFAFWSYLIAALQFDHPVRDEFFPHEREGITQNSCE